MEYCDRGDLGGYLQRMRDMAKSVVVGQVIQQQQKKGLGKGGTPGSVSSFGITELGESRLWKFFLEICFALEAIHDKGIVHADLKPSNCLLAGADIVLKITDFGVSNYLSLFIQFSFLTDQSNAKCRV